VIDTLKENNYSFFVGFIFPDSFLLVNFSLLAKREVTSRSLMKLFLSKYAYNIEKIVLGEDLLVDREKIGIENDVVA